MLQNGVSKLLRATRFIAVSNFHPKYNNWVKMNDSNKHSSLQWLGKVFPGHRELQCLLLSVIYTKVYNAWHLHMGLVVYNNGQFRMWLTSYKHSSLLQYIIDYNHKWFHDTTRKAKWNGALYSVGWKQGSFSFLKVEKNSKQFLQIFTGQKLFSEYSQKSLF